LIRREEKANQAYILMVIDNSCKKFIEISPRKGKSFRAMGPGPS